MTLNHSRYVLTINTADNIVLLTGFARVLAVAQCDTGKTSARLGVGV